MMSEQVCAEIRRWPGTGGGRFGRGSLDGGGKHGEVLVNQAGRLRGQSGGRGGGQLQLQLQAEQREERGEQPRHLRQPEQVVGEHQQLQPGLHSGLVMGDVRTRQVTLLVADTEYCAATRSLCCQSVPSVPVTCWPRLAILTIRSC